MNGVAGTTGSTPRRTLFVDERGVGLRTSWHPERGVVLSLWREDVCVGTFSLEPEEAGRLVAFLGAHLGSAAQEAAQLEAG